MSAPNFVNTDIEPIITEMIQYWQGQTGKVLQPAHIERLLVNMVAYRESLVRNQFNLAAQQMLVNYATGTMLDELGALVGVTRLPSQHAKATIKMQGSVSVGIVTIPKGHTWQTADGKVNFVLMEDTDVQTGVVTNLVFEAETAGTYANGYIVGTVVFAKDPIPNFSQNSELVVASAGGADAETDEQFRERIKLAPNQFSVAGSRDSYRYFALSAHPDIIDVQVTNPTPGTVQIYPLVKGGITTPSTVLNAVTSVCNGEKVRPLTDTVLVTSPTKTTYTIEMNIVVLVGYNTTDVKNAVEDALTSFAEDRALKLGLDVIRNKIIGIAMSVDGVYQVDLITPNADIVVGSSAFAYTNTISVAVSGTSNP